MQKKNKDFPDTELDFEQNEPDSSTTNSDNLVITDVSEDSPAISTFMGHFSNPDFLKVLSKAMSNGSNAEKGNGDQLEQILEDFDREGESDESSPDESRSKRDKTNEKGKPPTITIGQDIVEDDKENKHFNANGVILRTQPSSSAST